jgi:hypothetical protein
MTSREQVKKEIDTLPDETLGVIREFVLFQKQRLETRQETSFVEHTPVKQPKMVLGVEVPEGEEDDPFYSESNIRHLLESEKQFAGGKVVVKTWEELKAMEEA